MSLNVNADTVHAAIKRTIDEHEVVLFMKGEPGAPECGFSATVVKILDYLGIDFVGVDVLKNPAIRAGVKGFSDWPTVPQLYVRGEVCRRRRYFARDVPIGRTEIAVDRAYALGCLTAVSPDIASAPRHCRSQ